MKPPLAGARADSLYAIGYPGTGNLGEGPSVDGYLCRYKVDLGPGIEAGAADRGYPAFVGALVAKTLVQWVGASGSSSR